MSLTRHASQSLISAMLTEMKFKGRWRHYQERVLAEMPRHLEDGRLHIVAAPGSGKTVLGLEIMRRLGRPALILVPTLIIRDQWRERLFPMFLDDPDAWSAHISADLEAPATMTIATYQALHAVHASGAARFDALVTALSLPGPVTLIVDEAHHLRRSWWAALSALRERLMESPLVALTATPPYDAPLTEWARYEGLCGPVDSEISVPELVRSGDLCPHQDYVHISRPHQQEEALLAARRQAIEVVATDIFTDAVLLDRLATHPWLVAPAAHQEELLAEPAYVTAMMMALRAGGRDLPQPAIDMLGVRATDLPALTSTWLERLLEGLLNAPHSRLTLGDKRWTELKRALNGIGLIENGRVSLHESRAVFAAVAGSTAKLDSIVAIARAEADALGKRLRLVVLSDWVRGDDLPRQPGAAFAPVKLGVVPIFETLRRAGVDPHALAVLTGSLVILPAAASEALDSEAAVMGLHPAQLRCTPLPACPEHFVLEAEGAAAAAMVALVTRLFERGAVRLLVGTQALLGEGWDAPAMNSLILASNAGSYMLSNQMRGRAIRIDPSVPDKVAAIWHLATVPLAQPSEEPTGDVALLTRRFEAFEGISERASVAIRNGIDRLELDFAADAETQNANTMTDARERPAIAAKWRASLGGATPRSHVRRVGEASYAPRVLAWRDTLHALVLSGLSGGAMSAAGAVRHWAGASGITTSLMVFFGLTLIYSLPGLGRAGWLWWRNGSLEGSLAQVGELLVVGLRHAGLLRSDCQPTILVRPAISGRYEVIIEGATRIEERAFLDALAEVLGPVQNPRYLLVRESRLLGRRRADYHAVPTVFGARKDLAERFHRDWQRRIGSSQLVYTRTGAGRLVLLKARVQSFAAGTQRFFERRSVWM